ncbi:MAG TPA: hypothetical protein VLG38_07835 [Gammaproteobacteria bacterium]|nr:hypothetical protein [Gammaproteobacteria bacterium]
MERIITNPTSITQWQTLVTDASQICQVALSEELESYLVFLLIRFMSAPQMSKKVMGIEFMTSVNRAGSLRSLALRDVGDQCLLYSGLFPGRARRRLVRVSYYVNLGKTAYSSLADCSKYSDSGLFATLSAKFVNLMDILQAMREINQANSILDPLMAEELWHDTGSEHALQILKQFTLSTGMPITCPDQSQNKH